MVSYIIMANREKRVFACVLIREGDPYGVNGCLTHEGPSSVEFWDLTHPHGLITDQMVEADAGQRVYGQFTGGRYFLTTLIGEDKWSTHPGKFVPGINLYGGVPEWSIDAATLDKMLSFIVGEEARLSNA